MLTRNKRMSSRLLTVILVGLLCYGAIILYWRVSNARIPSAHERWNFMTANGPTWLANHPKLLWPDHPIWGQVDKIPELQAATWPGNFSTPQLRPPSDSDSRDKGAPALLMLHIFSMPKAASRRRRAVIRHHSPLLSIPEEYRYLVEVKFVLGRTPTDDTSIYGRKEVEEEEVETKKEQEMYGDLIRLDRLVNGENMNEGKSLAWARWFGRDGGREAQWVMKCDDDTLPILPNFLPLLLELDPSIPTYIGSSLGRWPGYAYYFQGMMYGFNWGVVCPYLLVGADGVVAGLTKAAKIRTLATADLGDEIQTRRLDEDAYTGMLMYNLPSRPDLSPSEAEHLWEQDASNGDSSLPISPDPRTGLVRVDLGTKAGSIDQWWIAGASRAVAWHPFKTDEAWIQALEDVTDAFERAGRDYVWVPPTSFASLADV